MNLIFNFEDEQEGVEKHFCQVFTALSIFFIFYFERCYEKFMVFVTEVKEPTVRYSQAHLGNVSLRELNFSSSSLILGDY